MHTTVHESFIFIESTYCTASMNNMDFDLYDYVRFTVADIYGLSRGKVIPRKHVPDVIRHGVACFSGEPILM